MAMHTYIIPPLMQEDYNEAHNQKALLKSNATALRRCIEGFIDIFFPELTKMNKLSSRITWLKKHGYVELGKKLDFINDATKAGAHYNLTVSVAKFKDSLGMIPELITALFVAYYKRTKIYETETTLVLLSIFPPVLRIKILTDYLDFDPKNALAVEKLAMAYCKNDMLDAGLIFLKQKVEADEIDSSMYSWLCGKITRIHSQLEKLPIATSLKESIPNFEKLLATKQYDNHQEFIDLMKRVLGLERL